MSVIAVRVEKDKIIIGSDQQISYWYMHKDKKDEQNPVKLHECNGVVFWWAGSLKEINLMKMYLETYEPKKIVDAKTLMDMINLMKTWAKDYDVDSIENQYLFVVWGRCFYYCENDVLLVHDYYAIWSWSMLAMACMSVWASVNEALKAACKYDLFCSEPLIIKTINS